jgi:hypothetical protein
MGSQKRHLRNFIIAAAGFLLLGLPTPGYCDIWDIVKSRLHPIQSDTDRTSGMQKWPLATYEQVVTALPLIAPLTSIAKRAPLFGRSEMYVLADGTITVSPHAIRVFDEVETPANYTRRKILFEHFFSTSSGLSSTDSPLKEHPLQEITVAIDVLETHPLFDALVFGSLTYKDFVLSLRARLSEKLSAQGARPSFLRPENPITTDTTDMLNSHPSKTPKFVVALQFNNDKQDCMTTFCAGNILQNESISSPRQKARMVHALLTGKAIQSARMAACLTHSCQNNLHVQPLEWEQSSFRGNTTAIAMTHPFGRSSILDTYPTPTQREKSPYYDGFTTRNLLHNGIFAEAVVVPFPDMQWVCKQVKQHMKTMPADEAVANWIEEYTEALTQGLIMYTQNSGI